VIDFSIEVLGNVKSAVLIRREPQDVWHTHDRLRGTHPTLLLWLVPLLRDVLLLM